MRISAGKYKNRQILAPKGLSTRPTQSLFRESLFNICQNRIENACFLDLFAGSGIMGIEALSRGAKETTFVDHDRRAIRCIQENIQKLDLHEQIQVFCGDVQKILSKLSQYDIIFADPPYKMEGIQELAAMIPAFLKPGGLFFLETANDFEIDKESLINGATTDFSEIFFLESDFLNSYTVNSKQFRKSLSRGKRMEKRSSNVYQGFHKGSLDLIYVKKRKYGSSALHEFKSTQDTS